MPASSYGINIPVNVVGREQLAQVDAAIRGVAGATKGLSADQKDFASIVRENLIVGKDYVRTLDSLRTAKAGVSTETKQLAASMQAYVIRIKEAEAESRKLEAQNRKLIASMEAQSTKFQTIGGGIAGRIGGMASGVPGGGMVGGQLARGIGGAGGLAVGGALVGVAAIAELVRITTETAKYAQAQQNLAAETGLTVQQTQLFGRVADIAGVQVNSLTGVSRKLYDAMTGGGVEAEKTSRALKEMGLSAVVAFEAPERQVSDILGALKRVTDQTERYRIANDLGVSSLLPLVDQYKQLDDSVRKSGVIMDDYAINQLSGLKEKADEVWLSMKRLGEMFSIGVGAVASAVDAYENFVPGGRGIPKQSAADEAGAAAQALLDANQQQVARARASTVTTLFNIDQAERTPVERLQAQKIKLESGSKAANDKAVASAGKPEDMAAYRSLRSQIKQNELQTKAAKERQSQQQELQRLMREPIVDNKDAIQRLGQLNRLTLLGGTRREKDESITTFGTPEYRKYRASLMGVSIAGNVIGPPDLSIPPGLRPTFTPGVLQGFQDIGREHQQTEADRNNKELTAEQKRKNDEDVRSQDRSISGGLRGDLDIARGTEAIGQSEQRQNVAIYEGQAASQRRYLTGASAAGVELTGAQSSASQENALKFAALTAEKMAQDNAAKQYGAVAGKQTDEGQRQAMQLKADEADARASQIGLDLQALEIDAKTKSIEAINKFNESLDKLDETMSKEFAGGFSSVIMGFQNKGGQGGLSALRSFFEGQESTVLKNVGQSAYKSIGAQMHVSDSSPISKFLEGTIFGPQGKKQTVELTDSKVIFDNTDSTNFNTKALEANTAAMGRASSAGVQSPSVIYDAQGNAIATTVPAGTSASAAADALSGAIPYAGSALDITSAAGVGSSIAAGLSSGNSSAEIASAGKSLMQLGSALAGGAVKAGNWDAISGNAFVPIPGQPGMYTNESTTQQIGAIAGTAALAAGAVGGIATIAHGGAKNAVGGTAETLAAIAPLTGPAAPFVASAAAVAGLISSFLPDPRTTRGQQIAKSIFTQQYLAPQSQNITESGTGGYQDFDISGGVRTSNFSPYPIISQSYSDVPRRVDVPGHTISTFGGYQNVTGAKVPAPGPTYELHIHALDSKSIIDRSGAIMDAIHAGLNGGYHPMINTLRGQLGGK